MAKKNRLPPVFFIYAIYTDPVTVKLISLKERHLTFALLLLTSAQHNFFFFHYFSEVSLRDCNHTDFEHFFNSPLLLQDDVQSLSNHH